jgi:hypothetical protein
VLVVQVAVAGLPDTLLELQPVFALHVTVPVTTCCFTPRLVTRPFTSPFSPLMVAVNVTDWPKFDGFALEVTAVVALAWLMAKLLVCELLDVV